VSRVIIIIIIIFWPWGTKTATVAKLKRQLYSFFLEVKIATSWKLKGKNCY